ncbi:MAG: MFS transporter [Clostridia bacterium]|nr:MFS transporter [Clostridia bacterium]
MIGVGSGAINTGLNNYVALHYHARHMNYLHCSYGIGTMCSTSLLAITLERSGWRMGYRYVFVVLAVIALMLFVTTPLWKREKQQSAEEKEEEQEKLSVFQMIKNPSVRTTWFAIFATNGIEYAAATYLSTYLVAAKGVSEKWGALAATLYFAGLALGRFLSGLISKKIKTWTRIFAGTVIVAVAIAAMFIPAVPVIIGAMFLIGFGNGSIYPNLIHLTPHNFEKKHSGSIMSTEIAVAYMGVMAAPAVMGLIMIWTGVKIFPVYMLFLLVLMIVSLLRMTRLLKKDGKFDKDV